MSLSASLGNAVSGLFAARSALDTISTNVSNANTAHYARKTLDLTAHAVDPGTGGGVDVRRVVRIADSFLQDAAAASTANKGRTESYASIMAELDAVLGEPGTGRDIATLVSNLRNALSEATASPQDVSKRRVVVENADSLARGISGFATAVTGVRDRTVRAFKESVRQVSDSFVAVAKLNAKIVEGRLSGADTGLLEDQRDAAVADASKAVNLTLLRRSSGAIDLFIGGAPTVLAGEAAPLTAVVGASGGISLSVGGRDVSSDVQSGVLKAYADVVNSLVPRVDAELRDLAVSVTRSMNAAHNQGTSVPGRSVVDALPWVSGGDSFGYSGTFRLMLVDDGGRVTASQDISLVGPTTLAGLVGQINLPGVRASLSDGGLKLDASAAAPARNLAWVEIGQATVSRVSGGGVMDTGVSLAQFLGLNDMYRISADSRTLSVRADLLARPELLAHAQIADAPAALEFGQTVTGPADGRNLATLSRALESRISAGGAFGGQAHTGTIYEVSQAITVSLVAGATRATSEFEIASTVADEVVARISNLSGVNIDEEMAQISLYQNAYGAAARVISVANQMLQDLTRIGQ